MKRIIRWCLVIIGILILILIVTCPNEDDYHSWLSKKHDISCITTGIDIVCKYNNEKIEWNSKHVRRAGVFMQVEDTYSISNTTFKIRTLGLFNHFIDYSSIIVSD